MKAVCDFFLLAIIE